MQTTSNFQHAQNLMLRMIAQRAKELFLISEEDLADDQDIDVVLSERMTTLHEVLVRYDELLQYSDLT